MAGRYIFGIDFGTTNTSVYYYITDTVGSNAQDYRRSSNVNYLFRSMIAVNKHDSNDTYYGKDAYDKKFALLESGDYHVISSFKSSLDTNEECTVGDKRVSAIELVADFLGFVRRYVNEKLKNEEVEMNSAVFTVPVDFSAEARKNLKLAAERAGISVDGYLTESTSAYLAKVDDIKTFSKVLVVDWGGGTLDLSVLRLNENRVYEDAVYGIKVGGDDIDEALARVIHSKINSDESFENSSNKDLLYARVEQAKIAFSESDEEYDIVIRGKKPVTVTYDQFTEIVEPIINVKVLGAIDTVLDNANVKPSGIDAVILAGGSSQIMAFHDAMVNIFGEDKLIFDDDYQLMVAKGAAYAGILGGRMMLNDDVCILMSDNTPYPLLRRVEDGVGTEHRKLTFSVVDDSSDAHFIFVDSENRYRYGMSDVRIKGYADEKLVISAHIDTDQIAKIRICNDKIGYDYAENIEINKLRFYYELGV